MKRCIIIGASSGIGRELAILLSNQGYEIGLMARRENKLIELQSILPNKSWIVTSDIANCQQATIQLEQLMYDMGKVDLVIITAGIGHLNPALEWQLEKDTIEVNVLGVTAMINESIKMFKKAQGGHLVVISSIAALRGGSDGPAYSASKAYMSNYLEGLTIKMIKDKEPITITDIRPGLVDTAMAKGEGLFWVEPTEKVAKQIYQAIIKKKRIAYVTKRWGLIAFLLRCLPFKLYKRM